MQELLQLFSTFMEPYDIQVFLNRLGYNPSDNCKSPFGVFRERTANCSEGAFFAAAALRHIGFKPLVLIMLAENDDDHLVAVFKKNDRWGCIAKSNTTTLRYREPVYETVRELVMSFFDFYFNTIGDKTLRKYSQLVDMSRFDKYGWTTSQDIDFVWEYMDKVKYFDLLSARMIKDLRLTDPELMKACFLFSKEEGLFKPKQVNK